MKLETRIEAVTVYPDRARITRQGTASLEAGTQQIEIENLPLRLDPASTRLAAHGAARARLLGLDVKRAFYAEAPVEQVRRLESQVEAAQDELQALQARLALAGQSRARLEAIANHTELYATALASGEQTVEAQAAIFDELNRQTAALDAGLQKLNIEKRAQERALQVIQRQLEQLRSQRPPERYTAAAEVEILTPGDLTLELTYVVSGAGWTPLYDLRLSEDGQPALEMGYLAQVSQQSGEDWPGVALTLSTARPALAARLPEVEPWYVQPAPPPPPPAAPAPRMAFKAQVADAAMPAPMTLGEMGAGAPAPAVEVYAEVSQSGAAVTYRVGGSADVPGDGAPHKVTVARYPLKPRLDYVCAPLLVEAAYRRARLSNDSPYTLLPGPANLFAGDEFVGATGLELTPPQAEIELYLGVDDRLKVERELKRREVDKTLLGGKRRVKFGYEIRLENLLDSPAAVTVHDRLPVARHEEIKVRLESAEPKPTRQSELNLLDWELSLAPKEKLTLRFDFSVEYPQTMDLRGLP